MNWKTSVLGGVLTVAGLVFVAGCNKPNTGDAPKKAPTPPVPATPNTTDSK